MNTSPVSISTSAAVAGVPEGTLKSWQNRGYAPPAPLELADVLSLTLAADLCRMGFMVEHAAVIGWLCREHWAVVLSEVERHRRLILLTRMGDDGRWIVAVVPWAEVPRPAIGGTLQVDLSDIARRVLAKLGEARKP